MTKIFLGVILIFFTTFCGYFLAKKYRKRKEFFRQLQELNERFLSELSYYKRPLKEFLSSYAQEGEFALLLEGFIGALEGEEREIVDDYGVEEVEFLTTDERIFLRDYLSMLGRGDSVSQKSFFSSMQASVVSYKNKSEEESKRYGDLYIKLGFLFGLAVLILMV